MNEVFARLTPALHERYRIERELGAGGMATVFRAHDLRHDRDVAVKVLHPEIGAMLGAQRFLAEITTTARLQHPHILPLLDSGDADGLLYYVMPVVDGESLRARLDREAQLPIDEAVRITSEVASALDYSHRHAVVHRDINPRTFCCTRVTRSSPISASRWRCRRPGENDSPRRAFRSARRST